MALVAMMARSDAAPASVDLDASHPDAAVASNPGFITPSAIAGAWSDPMSGVFQPEVLDLSCAMQSMPVTTVTVSATILTTDIVGTLPDESGRETRPG